MVSFSITDCSEDRDSPVISFKDALTVSAYEEEDGLTRIDSPAFASLEAARQYLRSILIAEDDCANDLVIDVASPPVAACAASVFTVTITDPRCSGTNPIQTVVERYALWVDSIPPTVSIVLERGPPQSNRLYSDPDGQYVHIDEGLYDFEDTEFSYFVNVSVILPMCFLQTFPIASCSHNNFFHQRTIVNKKLRSK